MVTQRFSKMGENGKRIALRAGKVMHACGFRTVGVLNAVHGTAALLKSNMG